MNEIQNTFIEFEKTISIKSDEKKILYDRMELAQRIISESFKKKDLPLFYFDLHGSFKTDTLLRTAKKVSDIDFGIYYISEPKQSPKELKSILAKAVQMNQFKAENKDKFVRVKFEDEFHLDITQYFLKDKNKLPRLAREGSWMPSDPVALYNWFLEISSHNDQLIRVVKYFKYWANLDQMKTPSGTTFCAWAGKHIQNQSQIDLCLFETAQSLLNYIKNGVYCRNPVAPYDNLVSNLQPRHKKNFLMMLEKFVFVSQKAIDSKDKKKSIQYWTQLFGEKFIDCNTILS